MTQENYTKDEKNIILKEARTSIEYYLKQKKKYTVDAEAFSNSLREKKATFVTLKKNHSLRGCIGILEASHPLIEDVVRNAYSAAFQDYRFSPVNETEFEKIHISVSILTKPNAMHFSSYEDFISQIKKDEDGIILKLGSKRATFLPSVWESIHEVPLFIRHLMAKAGIAQWDDKIEAERYRVIEISE